MIPDQIAFATKVDMSKCHSVQQFIQAQVNMEAGIRWACGHEERKLLTVIDEPESRESLYRRLSFVLP